MISIFQSIIMQLEPIQIPSEAPKDLPQDNSDATLERPPHRRTGFRFQFNFDWIRLGIFSSILTILLLGLIYNLFATSERDIPDEVFEKLYSLLKSQSSYMFAPLSDHPTATAIQTHNKSVPLALKWMMFQGN